MLFAKRVEKSTDWVMEDMADVVIDAAKDKLFRQVKYKNGSPTPFHRSMSPASVAGPVFTPLGPSSSSPVTSLSSRPSSALEMMNFKNFNTCAKPFCRAY